MITLFGAVRLEPPFDEVEQNKVLLANSMSCKAVSNPVIFDDDSFKVCKQSMKMA